MERRSYVIKGFPFIGYEVITVIVTKQMQREYKGSPIQIPMTKDNAKSTNHKGNVINVLRQIYNKSVSLTDIGLNAERGVKIHSTITEIKDRSWKFW